MKKTIIIYSLLIYCINLTARQEETKLNVSNQSPCNRVKNSIVGNVIALWSTTESLIRLGLEQKMSPKAADQVICTLCLGTATCCCCCCQGPVMTPIMVAGSIVAGYESGILAVQPGAQDNLTKK